MRIICLISGIFFLLNSPGCINKNSDATGKESHQHVKVFYKKGLYGGWPANWGIWSWDNEILVGFTHADHSNKEGHTYNRETALAKFARSMDGGNTWSIEDAFDAGITESTFEHNIGVKSRPSETLLAGIDFTHPDLAITFRMRTLLDGPSSFYYSLNRGRQWEGPFKLQVDFPGRDPAGIVSRTDYIIEGSHELTAFLTVGFREGDNHWREVAAVRTKDGGKTWNHLSWIGPAGTNSIMPSSVRLDSLRIITMIRRTKPPEMVSFLSEDNGLTWIRLDDPVRVDRSGNPPALLMLKDGRLCLVYGIRDKETMSGGIGIYATFSADEGKSWGDPVLIRGNDGASWDIGYPGIIQRPDGNVVVLYYYNNALDESKSPFRYIAATIFDPDLY